MGMAYKELIADREIVTLQLHVHAASVDDPALREASRAGFARIVGLVRDETGADDATIGALLRHRMLCNVVAALDLRSVDEPWARTLTSLVSADDPA